jgi:PIN domain nuclease of toxin-antitoxin system
LLLDSHALIWAVDNPSRLGSVASAELRNNANEVLLSAATIWELSIKCSLGKLSLANGYRAWMSKAMADLGVQVLPITVQHADAQATLPIHHRDRFDRMLIAQSLVENAPLVSGDALFDQYGVIRLS